MLVLLLGGCMVTSVFATNLLWVLLGANWLLEGRWREKWQMFKDSRLLQAFLTLYLLFIVGLLWTTNLHHGLSVLQDKLPLLVVPLVMLTSRPLTGHTRNTILGAYAITVTVVSVIGLVRLLTIPDLPYRNAVPYISHIRFALNCCMVVFLAFAAVLGKGGHYPKAVRLLAALVAAWMLCFLVLLRSYTGIAVLTVTSLALLLFRYRNWRLMVLWVAVVGTLATMTILEARNYYRLVPLATEPLRATTDGGRPYYHANDGMVENGNYINNYICTEELRSEWNRRSSIDYDDTLDGGIMIKYTLVRYLNALGLAKDSAGVAALTDEQVHAIEHNQANPVYSSHNPLRKMVYTTLFEVECHRYTQAVKGFTMLQRLALWRGTAEVIKENRWIGVGTGDADDELHAMLESMQSPMAGTTMRCHNQYLLLLESFGIVGFALLAFFFLRALRRKADSTSPRRAVRLSSLMLAWLLTVLISFLTEDTLDTLAGILFCTYFLAFRDPEAE